MPRKKAKTGKVSKVKSSKADPDKKKKSSAKAKKDRNKQTGPALVKKNDESPFLERRIKRAVNYIAIKDQSVCRSLENIGKHIVQHFFKGDLQRVKSHNPMKGFSLSRLAEQEGMSMSITTLQRCVGLFVQRKEIGTYSTLNKLSTSHRIALTQVEDIEQKKADIQLIIDRKLSVRQYLELLKNRYAEPELTDGSDTKKSTPYSDVNQAVHGITAAQINKLKAPARKRAVNYLHKMHSHIEQLLKGLQS